ncbi:MAG: sulfatase-like hydrolase/transferase [Bacteroidaceae bacterium]
MAMLLSNLLAFLWNLAMVFLAFQVCRLVFLAVNSSYFPHLSWAHLSEMLLGGLVFDTSAILYTNLLYLLLMLIPFSFKEGKSYQTIAKWIFVVTNSLAVFANLADVIYFAYTNRRTTSTVFKEFTHESNLTKIVGDELLNHWYLTLLAIAIVTCFILFYRKADAKTTQHHWSYYPMQLLILVLFAPLTVFGMRGGIGSAVRPITVSSANQYVDNPVETALVLNTPFSIYRTIGKDVFVDPKYFSDEKELEAIFTPIHPSTSQGHFRPKNVVVLIVESFGKEYIGGLNHGLEGGKYKGYTPFIDSLATQSLTWSYTFCNGRKSIDAMPSILSGIPMFIEPFFLTPASLNKVGGLAETLGHKGYYSAFFHGAKNGSMGFEAFSRATGFKDYYGRTEFDEDKHYRGDLDYDGTWAIWDEPFLQFFCDKMTTFKQPFVTALFTASSHHPFVIPEKYKKSFPEEGLPIHKCIRYTDHSLREFFEKAKKQPWYANTLFVLTSDHTNVSDHPEYQTSLGGFRVPLLFFSPAGDLKGCPKDVIAQQIDIMPTVLGYLGYDQPYFSFGCDLLHTPAEQTYAVNYLNGIYQYVKGRFLLQFDGVRSVGLYDHTTDLMLSHNLLGQIAVQGVMERELKAIIQQYMSRMLTDRISLNSKSK